MATIQTGIIRFFIPEKNYGYVRKENSLEEFHISGQKIEHLKLKKGDRISFQIKSKSNQLTIKNIQRIDPLKD